MSHQDRKPEVFTKIVSCQTMSNCQMQYGLDVPQVRVLIPGNSWGRNFCRRNMGSLKVASAQEKSPQPKNYEYHKNKLHSEQSSTECLFLMGRSKSPRVAQSRRLVAKSRREVAKSRRTPKTKKKRTKTRKNINVNNFLFVFERAPNLQAQVTAPKVAANKSKSPHKLWGRNSCR